MVVLHLSVAAANYYVFNVRLESSFDKNDGRPMLEIGPHFVESDEGHDSLVLELPRNS